MLIPRMTHIHLTELPAKNRLFSFIKIRMNYQDFTRCLNLLKQDAPAGFGDHKQQNSRRATGSFAWH